MSARIPTLEYPSRTAAVVALRAKGLMPSEIERLTGIKADNVHAYERAARMAGKRAHARKSYVVIDKGLLASLAPSAERRGLHAQALVRLIVQHVVADGLVDAILDDGAGQ